MVIKISDFGDSYCICRACELVRQVVTRRSQILEGFRRLNIREGFDRWRKGKVGLEGGVRRVWAEDGSKELWLGLELEAFQWKGLEKGLCR